MMTRFIVWCTTILARSRFFQYLIPKTHAELYHLIYLYSNYQSNDRLKPSPFTIHIICKASSRRESLKHIGKWRSLFDTPT